MSRRDAPAIHAAPTGEPVTDDASRDGMRAARDRIVELVTAAGGEMADAACRSLGMRPTVFMRHLHRWPAYLEAGDGVVRLHRHLLAHLRAGAA